MPLPILCTPFPQRRYAKAKLKAPGQALFYNTGEDDLAVIAQFYDVPVLSLRWRPPHLLHHQSMDADGRGERSFMLQGTATTSENRCPC